MVFQEFGVVIEILDLPGCYTMISAITHVYIEQLINFIFILESINVMALAEQSLKH